MMNQTDINKYIIVELEQEEYAIPVDLVAAIERSQPITRVPQTISCVKGVINLRGVITPIVDLRERFGMQSPLEATESTRIIIIHMEDYAAGLIVDAAYDVMDIPTEQMEPTPQVIGTVDVDYMKGVAKIDKRLIMILEMEKVMDMGLLVSVSGNEELAYGRYQ
ncbi:MULTISPECIES: chemotaxis protein CheW [Gracilibacillus]|uniref:chemotaxis protein CheW n=1 Tax=Gracilibacillus TaxID=74385 RepID=UPI000825BC83|nr:MULTISPECIES: chemotaxis protein CheW [Gracilibacillus]